MRKPIFVILIVLGFILPITANAALVTCGTSTAPQECTLCDIFRMMQTIMNYIWWALLVIAPLFIIAGGLMILTAGVKPEQLESGKRIITGTVIGLAIAFLSWTILNVIFIELVKEPGQEGFPWPWNEIQCTGGGVAQTQPCTTDAQCSPPNTYCDWFGTNRCVTAENLVCELWVDCPSAYDCVGTGALGRCTLILEDPGEGTTGNYCCCNYPDGTYICSQFNTYNECQTDCLAQCQSEQPGFTNYCCLNQRAACSAGTGSRCGQMSVSGPCGYSLNGALQCQAGVIDQISDTSIEMLQFLNCMANYMTTNYTLPSSAPDFRISSLTDNSGGRCINNWTSPQCTGNTDSCSGTCCAHMQPSLHYGGTGTSSECRGTSYAVDIAVLSPDAHIQAAFNSCSSANSSWGAQLVPESTHIHIELDGLARNRNCL